MLTNERINRMVGRTNWLLITFANGTQSIALDPVAARNFARAIEAEVLQSQELVGGITPFNPLNAASNVLPCRAQNATHAPQDVLQNADAERGKEVVAWFAFADNNGPVPLELWGFDLKACKHAVLENARSVGWKGTVEGYLFQKSWTIRPLVFATPQPPAPCPDSVRSNIAGQCRATASDPLSANIIVDEGNGTMRELLIDVADALSAPCPRCTARVADLFNEQHKVDALLAENDKLQAKVAELESFLETVTVLCEKAEKRVIEQIAAIERLTTKSLDWLKQWNLDQDTIAQQAERIAELERNPASEVLRTNARLEVQIAEQTALIEKCEKALRSAAEWGAPMQDAPKSSRPEWFELVNAALAAIAAMKGGAK